MRQAADTSTDKKPAEKDGKPEKKGPEPRGLRPVRVEELPVTPDAKVLIDGKEGVLTDLKRGMTASVSLQTDGRILVITRVEAAKGK